jgi:hypothetical protein
MKTKKILGWILLALFVIFGTMIFIQMSGLKIVVLSYIATALIVGFIFLIGYLIFD